jgi:hypothetical protein
MSANHSLTKCPKCDKTIFELVEDFPLNSRVKFWYMRCHSCRTFLYASPYQDTNTLISSLQADIDKLKAKLGVY